MNLSLFFFYDPFWGRLQTKFEVFFRTDRKGKGGGMEGKKSDPTGGRASLSGRWWWLFELRASGFGSPASCYLMPAAGFLEAIKPSKARPSRIGRALVAGVAL